MKPLATTLLFAALVGCATTERVLWIEDGITQPGSAGPPQAIRERPSRL